MEATTPVATSSDSRSTEGPSDAKESQHKDEDVTSRRVRTWYIESADAEDVVPELHTLQVSSRAAKRMSTASQAAGGFEDWTDLDSTDVDRYGFYNTRPEKPSSGAASKQRLPSQSVNSQPPLPTTAPGRLRSRKRRFDKASKMLTPAPEPEDAKLERTRAVKWARMARRSGNDFVFDAHDPQVIRRTWKGIPDCWRGAAWFSFMSKETDESEDELVKFYDQSQHEDCLDDVQIDMDVPRTVGRHVVFRQRYRGGQRLLFRVLRAIALYFPAVGYVQGMAPIVATLLNYFTEERAFIMAVWMWKRRGIAHLFQEGFEGLMATLSDLEKWLDIPAARRLRALGIDISAWGPKWYLTLFNHVLPYPAQLRIWDVFLLQGHESFDVLHASATAVLVAINDSLVFADFEGAMKILTGPVPVHQGDLLMQVARQEWQKRQKR